MSRQIPGRWDGGSVDTETQRSFGMARRGSRMAHPRDLEHLVLALMERAERAEGLVAGPGVVLDLTVRNVRCLLIRYDRLPTLATLSPREREIARMVATGLTNKSIAQMLDISPWTVSTHLRRIFAKLSVTSRAAMVARLLTWKPPTQEPLPNDACLAVQDLCCDPTGARPAAS
jgi:DNA-binding CsgD family transcriptional regulator